MFERYTEHARRALFFARYEVSQLGSVVIEPEHLLLGLIRDARGLTGPILARLGISREDIRRELEGRSAFREKVATSVEIPFGEQAKRVLRFASEEAAALSHNYIGPGHLLLGVLREERSVAASVLMTRGLRAQAVRDEIQRLLKDLPEGVEEDTTTHFADHLNEEHLNAPPGPPPHRQEAHGWSLQLRDGAYWFHREGQAPEGPYCATCWDTERRWVRKGRDGRGGLYCGTCR